MKLKPWNDPHFDRFRNLLSALKGESDRGAVLVHAAVIEELLGEVLEAFLLDDKVSKSLLADGYAPLSTFKAKLNATRAMGLISGLEYQDIELIRKIRNKFAHSVLVSFTDASISDMAGALKVSMEMVDEYDDDDPDRFQQPRQRFEMSASALIATLYNRAHYAKEQRLTERTWP